MTTVIAIHIILLVVLTLWSAFFSGSEIAMFSLSSHKVKTFRHSDDRRKQAVASLLRRPRDLLVTIFLFNTVVNILLQNVASSLFGELSGWLLKVGVPLLITLILGEIIPKYLAIQHNAAIATRVAPLVSWFQNFFAPLRVALTQTTNVLSRVMFFFLHKDKVISREEIQHVLDTSEKAGILHGSEVQLVNGYLEMRESQVKELMRPKEDIIAYDIGEPLSRLTHLFVDLECSRIPVYDGNIDRLLGIFTAQRYFIYRHSLKEPKDLVRYLEKPVFIPETAPAPAAMRQLDFQDREVALVVDEYGSISGLIAYEDLVEEVIGEITDRRDEKPRFTRSSDNVIIASGKLEIAELEEIFGVELDSAANMVSVGGWLTEQLGDIPHAGAHYQSGELLFHVLAADPNRVRRVYIRRLGGTHQGGSHE